MAVAELRTKLALAPDRLPEPPPPSSGGSTLVWAGRITAVGVVMAVGFVGYRWGSSPHSRLVPHPYTHARQPAPVRSPPSADQDQARGGMTVTGAVPAVYPPPGMAAPPSSTDRTFRQLVVGPVPAQLTDEAARLAISAPDAGPNASIVIVGLMPGSTLSAGHPVTSNSWRLSVEELAGASITPPKGFVGPMDVNVELRFADGSVADRKGMRLEWLNRSDAAKPQPRHHDAAEIAQMIKKGADLMANGDVAAARLMYQRAAEAGEADAAFALAETYDPLVLARGGIASDVAQAEAWYAKARELGSTQAPERLDRLARSPEQ